MNKIVTVSIVVLIFNLPIFAQTKKLNNLNSAEISNNKKGLSLKRNPGIDAKKSIDNSDTIEISLEKAEGFGPNGNSSHVIAPKSSMDSLELAAFPKMKNIPNTLSNVVEYCFHLNRFQFFYQNYRKGVFPKDYFFKEAARQKWNLKDTIRLTEKELKNTISIATGVNSEGNSVCIIDSQNNDDFSDDVFKILLSNVYKQDDVVSNSLSIDVEAFNGESVKKEKQLMFVELSRDKKAVSFSFPQFRYGRFKYKNKSYLISGESYSYFQSIYVLEDKPYFSSPGRDKEIKPFQFVELGGDYFQYIPKSQNSEKILLQKVPRPEEKSLLVSNQVEMVAPNIKGLNILNDSNISLKSTKGKYVFIDFWSTSCGPCIAEFPNIKEAYEKYDRSQLEIIGIVDDRTGGKIKEFIQSKNLIWPNINMNIKSTVIQGYDIKSYPTTYLIDPNGIIIATNLRGSELLNKLLSLKVKE
ncbi:TlpA family protein disulfide reductase [Flavobacterium pectinovorum]|uniref:TlpA family protein disulfide reductase n=1 Tax=Flavobacterium pectinovorum TaxID=29533 RepID=UPI001FAE3F6E|nr:TlpA disulfide reductase family protein [Flavobacterium pectinovorum]MCI9843967.1 TlpA family protein disulfide reductase [Flavobacterium pectinovorum]